MIIWYCDICNKRIADDSTFQCSNMPVWELNGSSTPIRNVSSGAQPKEYMKMIVCEECHDYVLAQIYKTIQQGIKDKRRKEELGENK